MKSSKKSHKEKEVIVKKKEIDVRIGKGSCAICD